MGILSPPNLLCQDVVRTDPLIASALTLVKLVETLDQPTEPFLDKSSQLLNEISNRLKQTEALLAIRGFKSVNSRIRAFLGWLKQEYGEPVETGVRIPFKLSHLDVAHAIGTTRVTVTRQLSEFRKQGWLERDEQRHWLIHD